MLKVLQILKGGTQMLHTPHLRICNTFSIDHETEKKNHNFREITRMNRVIIKLEQSTKLVKKQKGDEIEIAEEKIRFLIPSSWKKQHKIKVKRASNPYLVLAG